MDNPFVKNFDDLLQAIAQDAQITEMSLYIASDKNDSIFEELLVQPLVREIEGVKIRFLSIRNIKLKDNYKSKKLFTNFVKQLENLYIPIMFHDVVNKKLVTFFERNNYYVLHERKYNASVVSYYKYGEEQWLID